MALSKLRVPHIANHEIICFHFLSSIIRERTIHLAADTIRFDAEKYNRYDANTIRLLNCLLC